MAMLPSIQIPYGQNVKNASLTSHSGRTLAVTLKPPLALSVPGLKPLCSW